MSGKVNVLWSYDACSNCIELQSNVEYCQVNVLLSQLKSCGALVRLGHVR